MVNWGKLIFGGVDSSEYGIYITGEGVYNAPERAVEFVDIPGRNGAVAIDQGRYENIVVTYPAGVFGKDPEEFREALSDFRNAILSQKGYQRLEDTYHPEEFREAIYVAGIEVEPSQKKAGKFELTFNCKPQRWLTIGDYPIPVESGDVLENPTRFDSSPLLEVEGYGTVSFNGFNVELDNSPLGDITLIPRHYANGNTLTFQKTYKFDRTLLNTGDEISVGMSTFEWFWHTVTSSHTTIDYQVNPISTFTPLLTLTEDENNNVWAMLRCMGVTFYAIDQNDTVQEQIGAIIINWGRADGATDTIYIACRIQCGYDYITFVMGVADHANVDLQEDIISSASVEGDSTVQLLGNPTYIDCEVGEAYRIEDGEYKSSNAKVSLGSDLPVLSPGSNKIIFDDTVTDLKIAPRWWRI